MTNNNAISQINAEMGLLRNNVNIFKQGDTDWTDVKLFVGTGSLKYRKIGNVVNVAGKISGITGQWQTVANLPKPIMDFNLLIPINSNGVGSARLQTNGNLILYYHDMNGGNFVASESISINCTYITSEPAKINNVYNVSTEESSNNTNYSTAEQKIGTWIDGKSLYRKVIVFGNLPNATSKTVTTDLLPDQQEIVKISGIARGRIDNVGINIPIPSTTSVPIYIRTTYNGRYIEIASSSDLSQYTAFVLLEYVK